MEPTQAKIHLYLWWIASEDVETQQRGVVFVVMHSPTISDAISTTPASSSSKPLPDDEHATETTAADGQLPSMAFLKFYVNRRRSLPTRMVAMHSCTPDTPFYSIVRSINTVMAHERSRVKVHIGTYCI